jgi:hypothetical protein
MDSDVATIFVQTVSGARLELSLLGLQREDGTVLDGNAVSKGQSFRLLAQVENIGGARALGEGTLALSVADESLLELTGDARQTYTLNGAAQTDTVVWELQATRSAAKFKRAMMHNRSEAYALFGIFKQNESISIRFVDNFPADENSQRPPSIERLSITVNIDVQDAGSIEIVSLNTADVDTVSEGQAFTLLSRWDYSESLIDQTATIKIASEEFEIGNNKANIAADSTASWNITAPENVLMTTPYDLTVNAQGRDRNTTANVFSRDSLIKIIVQKRTTVALTPLIFDPPHIYDANLRLLYLTPASVLVSVRRLPAIVRQPPGRPMRIPHLRRCNFLAVLTTAPLP